MFKPARMTRLLVGGHTDRMEEVIETLHQEGVLHLEDYQDTTGTTRIGTPLEAGDSISDLLVRVRGLMKALEVEGFEPKTLATDDPAHLVEEAEQAILSDIDDLAGVRAQRAALVAEKDQLLPLSTLDVDLGALTSISSVRAFLGTVREAPDAALAASGVGHEVHTSKTGVGLTTLVLARPDDASAVERALGGVGFQAIAVPAGVQGTPREALAAVEATLADVDRALEASEAAVTGLRDKWGRKLTSLEHYLSAEAEKTLAPLQFGVTESTFHLEGWVPRGRMNRVQNVLAANFGDALYVEDAGDVPRGHHSAAHDGHDGHEASPQDEAPTMLENKGPARHYEFMLGLMSLPRYKEIDPTKLLSWFFPLFFGLMVGDVAIGALIILFAWYLKNNNIFGIGGNGVSKPLMWGGIIAVIVGLFVFGEALGLHFVVGEEALAEGEHSWESAFGFQFPTEGFIHKVDPTAAAEEGAAALHTLAESHESAGLLSAHPAAHLSVNGWFNLGVYSKVHDVEALLVWSVLIGLTHLILGLFIGFRNIYVAHGAKLAVQEKLSWLMIMASVGVIYWGVSGGPAAALWGGVGLFLVSVALLWMGVQHTIGVGFIAILELPGLLGNLLSYTRLAAIGASKAGMAIAFATIGFELIGGVAGIIVYLIASLLITVLAILSGGLQALRLQFVEFFSKFYEGGGRPYTPFGRDSKHSPSSP